MLGGVLLWMHRLSGRQEAMLKELHEVASRIEKFSKAELHPAVKQIKEHVAGVAIAVAADDASGQAIKH